MRKTLRLALALLPVLILPPPDTATRSALIIEH